MAMKVHAFKVEYISGGNLPLIFDEIQSRIALHEHNVRPVGGCSVRLENLSKEGEIWLANFIKEVPGGGPKKFCASRATEGFEFEEDEGFGEETACLYDPKTEHMVIQFNQSGVKASHIAVYLNTFLHDFDCEIELKPKIDRETQRRLDKKGIFKKIALTVALNRVGPEDFDGGMGLERAIQYGKESGADTIKIEISVGRGGGSLKDGKGVVEMLLKLVGREEKPLRRLDVSGKDDKHSKTEILDLIDGRLVHEFGDIDLDQHRSYPVDERWSRLLRAWNKWKNMLE